MALPTNNSKKRGTTSPACNLSEHLVSLINKFIPEVKKVFYLPNMCLTTRLRDYLLEKAIECRTEAFAFTKEIARVKQTVDEAYTLFAFEDNNMETLAKFDRSIRYIAIVTLPKGSIESVISIFLRDIYTRISSLPTVLQKKVFTSIRYQLRKLVKMIDSLVKELIRVFEKDSHDAFLFISTFEENLPRIKPIGTMKKIKRSTEKFVEV